MKELIKTHALKAVFIALWVIILVFTIVIFPLSKTEKSKFETTYKYYELGSWTLNGKRINLPYVVDNSVKSNKFRLTTTLPGDTRENCSLMFSTNYSKYRVYVDRKLIFSYGYTAQLPFGDMTGNNFLMIPLERSYSNKELTIVTERVFHLDKVVLFNEYSLPKVYYGDTASFKLNILSNNVWRLVFISFLAAMSVFCLCFVGYQMILGTYHKNIKEFFYLAALAICIAGWILGESSLLQYITNSSEATAFLKYISLSMGCVPFLGYCGEMFESKKKVFDLSRKVAYIVPFVTIITFITNICNPVHLLTVSQLLIVVSFGIAIFFGVKEWKADNSVKIFLISIILAGIVCACGLVFYFTTNRGEGESISNWLSFGLTFFVFILLAISLVREIIYIQECKSYDIYKKMAFTDKLTECGNRAALDAEILEGTKIHSYLTFVLVDFNHLKHVNDKLGHIAGDKMISDGADCLKKAFAPDGKVYRLGGDEFAIVLWDEEGKIESYYTKLDEILDEYNKVNEVKITMAKGHYESVCRYYSTFFDEMYNKADKIMYVDKERWHQILGGRES